MYLFCRGGEELASDLVVAKMNMANGQWQIVANLDVGEGDTPRGMFITNQVDIYSWVMLGLIGRLGDTPDRLGIWQVDARKEWMRLTPEEGVIGAGETDDFVFTLDSHGLPEARFEGRMVFIHDGIGGETAIPVELDVVQGEVHTLRRLRMGLGWNMVSASLQPDSTDVAYLTRGLVESGRLLIMKDGGGNFYWPAREFNNIEGWAVSQGYLLKLSGPAELILEGMSVLRDAPIALHEGWQMVSYYPSFPIEASVAYGGIADHLMVAKNGRGDFYVPAWNFSNMGNLRDGQGYQVLVNADVELRYQWGRGMPRRPGDLRQLSVYDQPGTLPVVEPTGSNQSLLVLADESLAGEIGVYTSGRLVGSGVLTDGTCGIAVWGDDPTTEESDGAVAGQALELRVDGRSAVYEVLAGETSYRADGLTVVRLTNRVEAPAEFGIVSAYPNPFNAGTRIAFALPAAADVTLKVFDVTGREVAILASGRHKAGLHAASWDGSVLSSGVFIARLEAAGRTSQMKLALVK
jgi:hypothetical protein